MSSEQGGVMLASGGDTLSIWDGDEGYSRIQQFNPHSSSISNICWAPDDTFIASASSSGDKICMTSCVDGVKDFSLADQMGKTCLTVCSQSHNLLAGGKDGSVHVWDVRSLRLRKTFQDLRGAVSSVAINCNDTLIASSSASGELHIVNLVTGQKSKVITAADGLAVRQVRFSRVKKSVLGHVDDTGTVCLWDAGAKIMTQKYESSHKASATGLSFSALNHMLMMSVGLDKLILCYDITSKKILKAMHSDSPLTSVDFLRDGVTLSVGTSRGYVHIYDLRSFTAPLHTIHGHKSLTVCVAYRLNSAPLPDSKIKLSRMGSKNSIQSGYQDGGSGEPLNLNSSSLSTNQNKALSAESFSSAATPVLPTNSFYAVYGVKTHNETSQSSNSSSSSNSSFMTPWNLSARTIYNKDDITNSNYELKSAVDVSEIFSPVRDEEGRPNQSMTNSQSYTQLGRPFPSSSGENMSNMSVFSPASAANELFSPIQSQTSEVKRSYLMNTTNTISSKSNPAEAIPASAVANDFSSPAGLVATTAAAKDSAVAVSSADTCSTASKEMVYEPYRHKIVPDLLKPTASSEPVSSSAHQEPFVVNISTNSNLMHTSALNNNRTSSSVDNSVHASARSNTTYTAMDTLEPPHAASLGGASELAAASRLMPTEYQAEFILRMVRDELDEFREEMRMTQLNMHMDMLKQFQIQQTELKSMIETYSINHELVTEIQRLRAENERLRKTY